MAREPCEYRIGTQCKIPLSLILLHNFFRKYDPNRHREELSIHLRDEPATNVHGDQQPAPTTLIAQDENTAANARRERIAAEMWEQYQGELATRRERYNAQGN